MEVEDDSDGLLCHLSKALRAGDCQWRGEVWTLRLSDYSGRLRECIAYSSGQGLLLLHFPGGPCFSPPYTCSSPPRRKWGEVMNPWRKGEGEVSGGRL